jgi:hypothetical protein
MFSLRVHEAISDSRTQLGLFFKTLDQEEVEFHDILSVECITGEIRRICAESVQTVYVRYCEELEKVTVQGVAQLSILHCSQIQEFECSSSNLQRFENISVTRMDMLLNRDSFTLRNLTELSHVLPDEFLHGSLEYTETVFPNLKKLSLFNYRGTFEKVALILPNLESLAATCLLLDLSHCSSLTSLHLEESTVEKGWEISQQLKHLGIIAWDMRGMTFIDQKNGDKDNDHAQNDENDENGEDYGVEHHARVDNLFSLPNLQSITLHANNILFEEGALLDVPVVYLALFDGHAGLSIGPRVKSLTIENGGRNSAIRFLTRDYRYDTDRYEYGDDVNGLASRRYFEQVKLSVTELISDYSIFSGAQQLVLPNCPNLIDISSLLRVPYLDLNGCKAIKRFTGLGPGQRYLDVSETMISDQDLPALSSVYHLRISGCPMISRIDALTDNVELIAMNNLHWQAIELGGESYSKVDLTNCTNLVDLSSGRSFGTAVGSLILSGTRVEQLINIQANQTTVDPN